MNRSSTHGAGAPGLPNLQAWGLLLMRSILGVVFFFHGAQKLFGWFGGYGFTATSEFFESLSIPFPAFSTAAAGGAEFLGGLLLLTGIAGRTSGVLLFGTMMVASFTAHSGFGAADGGFEYPLTLGLVALGLALTDMGPLTLTRVLRRAVRSEPSRGPRALASPGSTESREVRA